MDYDTSVSAIPPPSDPLIRWPHDSSPRDAALTAGVNTYRIKPLDPALLVATVAQLLGHGQAT